MGFKQNRVELKKLSINQRLSEETLCFSADIYLDDRKVGVASNHGTGGPTEIESLRTLFTQEALVEILSDIAEKSADDDAVRWSNGPNAGKLVEGPGQLINDLAYAMDNAKREARARKKEDKIEKEMVANCRARGMGCVRLRFDFGWKVETTWSGFRAGKLDGVVAELTKKYAPKGEAKVESTVVLDA